MSKLLYKISIDTGGTFTDCVATDTIGEKHFRKVLSNSTLRGTILSRIDEGVYLIKESWQLKKDIIQNYIFKVLKSKGASSSIKRYDWQNHILFLHHDIEIEGNNFPINFEISAGEEAPVLGIRLITQTALDEAFPPLELKLGSTKGTNALLENKGAKTALFITKGFKDILKIGSQQRPDIFALNIIKSQVLYREYIEIEERINSKGEVLKEIQLPSLEILQNLKEKGIQSIAISLLNAYQNPEHEIQLKNFLTENGFRYLSVATDLSPLIKFLNRTETAVVNAYLSPIIHNYLQNIRDKISENKKQSFFKVMSSSGSLYPSEDFHAKDSLLSGPAGGIVGAAQKAKESNFEKIITFDMGGTSTDVARYDGEYDYTYNLEIGNAHIFSPALRIETVAAGGGSLCYFDGYKLCVGPESAGAFPGPASYGAGGGLTITDVNLLLGRLDAGKFGIPVFPEDAQKQLDKLISEIKEKTGHTRQKEEVLLGFLQIANERMAQAIQKISLSKGYDPADYTLLAFGGAGGLHACNLADLLSIKNILVPQSAGLLSAYGISQALTEHFAEKLVLKPLHTEYPQLENYFEELKNEAFDTLKKEGISHENIILRKYALFLRLKGQESHIEVAFDSLEKILRDFQQKYELIYGYFPTDREIEIETIRVIASEKGTGTLSTETKEIKSYLPQENHFISAYIGISWQKIPVYLREDLNSGALIQGFALLLDDFSTTVIESGWQLQIDEKGAAILQKQGENVIQQANSDENIETQLELFSNRFMHIAENMGETTSLWVPQARKESLLFIVF